MVERAGVILLVLGLLLGTACVMTAEEPPLAAPVRVGTFDSRAVAIAYSHSDLNKRELEAVTAEYERAKAEGNTAKVAEIDREMEARQERRHEQGFGTASVDDLLDPIRSQLPEVAAKAGVDVIVSQWDVVYRRTGVDLVDVTDLVVEPFHPNAKALEYIRGIRDKKPVPVEELRKHPKH